MGLFRTTHLRLLTPHSLRVFIMRHSSYSIHLQDPFLSYLKMLTATEAH